LNHLLLYQPLFTEMLW